MHGILNNSVSKLDGLGILRLGLGTCGFGYTGCPFCFENSGGCTEVMIGAF